MMPSEEKITITCFIRYEIDPFKKDKFAEYSRTWGRIIPRCGVDLIGYFGPHEGSATTGYGVYNIKSLADYEAYRIKLANDDEAKANFAFAASHGIFTREDRIFLRKVSS